MGILLDEEQKPVGGKWSFDEENGKNYQNNRNTNFMKLKQLDYGS